MSEQQAKAKIIAALRDDPEAPDFSAMPLREIVGSMIWRMASHPEYASMIPLVQDAADVCRTDNADTIKDVARAVEHCRRLQHSNLPTFKAY